MLVHVVSFGFAGGLGLGSRDIMAASRVWAHSFAGLRRLHSLSSCSVSASPRTWSLQPPIFDPIVHQRLKPTRFSRSIAHAAAVDESSDSHKKKGERLSRAERYALVESFVSRHKAAHEGKLPSLSAVLKETGGSRVIVKDILDELTSKSSTGESASSELDSERSSEARVVPSSGRMNIEEVSTSDLSGDESEFDATDEASPTTGQSPNTNSGEVASDAGLWRRLRSLGSSQQEDGGPQRVGRSSPVSFDSYDSELDEAEDADEFEADDYEEADASTIVPAVVPGSSQSRPAASPSSSASESHGLFIRFLPLSATESDLRAAFQDCGEIVRAQAMQPKGSGLRFTYGFVDFSTPEALSKALKKDKVFIKGSTVITEPCSGPRRTPATDSRSTSYRNQASDSSKRIFTNTSSRSVNGSRSSILTRLRRTDSSPGGSETVYRTSSLPERNSRHVTVEGLPYPMPISAIEKMMSAHGEIARSELGREEGGTYSAQVEFKTEIARDSALNASRVYLGGRWCRVTTGEPILTTVVRLSHLGADASENVILQRCQKLGRVEEIVVRTEGVMDVYYHPSEKKNMRRILDKLGEMNVDYRKLQASLAPKCTLQELRDSAEIQDWVEVQKDRILNNLTSSMKSMQIDLEDLRDLMEAERLDLTSNGASRTSERPAVSRWNRS
ncbi:hypothetical protein R1sor_006110 [Riccia sorocarpa]|uniref:RRM domain-containing protein n=1 Tax=Riccia sorocarpa TaxID=122646 RepID=A0ABD3HQ51_9MARC